VETKLVVAAATTDSHNHDAHDELTLRHGDDGGDVRSPTTLGSCSGANWPAAVIGGT